MSTSKTRPWPDLSAYNIHFGIIDMPNKEKRLVMVDETNSWGQLARTMGFQQSRWVGLWVKPSLQFEIPGFAKVFPKGGKQFLTDQQISENIKTKILSRQSHRLSQANANGRKNAWHPSKGAPVANRTQVEERPLTVPADVAVRQTLYLGLNSLSQDVFESGDGKRFIKAGEQIVAREGSEISPIYLRQQDQEDLIVCAAGLVAEIVSGKILRSDDFERYINACFGEDAESETKNITAFHNALDVAMMQKMVASSEAGASMRESFLTALQLHNGRPTYWRAAGTLPTPLPLAAIVQSLVKPMLTPDSVVVDLAPSAGMHSWEMAQTKQIASGALPKHDITVGGIFSAKIDETVVSGVRVSRADHERILSSLEQRAPEGMSAFIIAGGTNAGKMEPDFKRTLSYIGARFELQGLTDIDPHMISAGNEIASRIIVVGKKRTVVDDTWAVPMSVPVCYDYDQLWSWAEEVKSIALGEDIVFADDLREENRWQSPYIPFSQVSEPEAMSPRNLLGPVRKALARIVEATGMGIDEYVATKLQWSMEELEKYLSAEQVDAVALSIASIEDKKGFVEADQTGIGKGRVLAATARYARLAGINVAFVTESKKLFRDFYRDIEDIGSLALFRKPLIINSDIEIKRDDVVLVSSPTKMRLTEVLQADEFPADYDIVMATYSQFNKKPESVVETNTIAAAKNCYEIVVAGGTRSAAMEKYENVIRKGLGLDSPLVSNTLDDNVVCLASLNAAKAVAKNGGGMPLNAAEERQRQYRMLSDADFEMLVHSKTIVPVTILKQRFIRNPAVFENTLLILDESHNAAGPDSQTNENLGYGVHNALSVTYSSATFSKEVHTFGIYKRIFPDSVDTNTIAETLDRGGAPLQEIVSAMLAEDGRMIRREHDLSNLEFKFVTDEKYDTRNTLWANRMAEILSGMSYLSGEIETIVNNMNDATREALQEAKEQALIMATISQSSKSTTKEVGVQYTNFASQFYNISRVFQMATNADLSADYAIKALQEGRKPVITVQNTMESALRHMLSNQAGAPNLDDDANQEVDLVGEGAVAAEDLLATPGARIKAGDKYALRKTVGFKDLLKRYADSLFLAQEVTMVNGKIVKRRSLSLKKPEMEVGINAIYMMIDGMPHIPLSPVDYVKKRITDAGFSIDEITGRRLALEESATGNQVIAVMPKREDHDIIDRFNNGQIDAVVISESGSTGISLHSSAKFDDHSQRELIELQQDNNIVKRLQFWGRVDRKGQVCSPIITVPSSGLPGETRLNSMQNSSLRKMSANISGNADNSAHNQSAPEILNRVGNEVCFRWLEQNPKEAKLLGVNVEEILEAGAVSFGGTKFVDRLTGRIMMFDVARQTDIYNQITSEFKALIQQYELEGRNPLKSEEHDFRAKRGTSVVAYTPLHFSNSIFDTPVMATEVNYVEYSPAKPVESVVAEIDRSMNKIIAANGLDYVNVYVDNIRKTSIAVMQNMLPSRFGTVEQALADSENNIVKIYAAKADWIIKHLGDLQPGSVFSYNRRGEDPEYFVLAELFLPYKNVTNPAMYDLLAYSTTTQKQHFISFSSLMLNDAEFNVVMPRRHQDYETRMPFYMQNFGKPRQVRRSRVILEGNLYKAAEMSNKNKVGSAVTYTDEKGIWHHAVMMPSGFTLEDVDEFSIEIMDAKMLQAALTDNKSVRISNSFKREDQVFVIGKTKTSNAPFLHLYGQPATCRWASANKSIVPCMTGDFKGSRTMLEASVDEFKMQEFCEAFMAAALKAGIKPLLDPRLRAWVADYAQSLQVPTAAQQAAAVIATAKSGSDVDDLMAQMSAMKI